MKKLIQIQEIAITSLAMAKNNSSLIHGVPFLNTLFEELKENIR